MNLFIALITYIDSWVNFFGDKSLQEKAILKSYKIMPVKKKQYKLITNAIYNLWHITIA